MMGERAVKITRIKSWRVATVLGMSIWVSLAVVGCSALEQDTTLYCGQYTQANADGTNGCEVLPEYLEMLERKPLPPCVTEDSGHTYPCVWDATLRGNGEGRSFVRYDVEHIEWTDDVRKWPDLYDVTCQLSGEQVTCWSK
jgi:hypothetical protein